ncbi:hypothetical protein MM1S1540310_4955 [Mycobacteroides abscessus subsp. bolletii 1S-154-0310]|uniref:Uncharacterized protein n=1 Tax=Mycobacteroides abscessus MAB_091912_2446 TaxID=1335414 RepID=A0A829MBF4_9MYCO|nr:hypothetical protein MM1S1530915_4949 [Mycobacteroides abscessus subsp. bolletii 1S-153-0915]EIU72365.1 hypothetical protein MM1S1520914_0618 [Mycobacteroides abscessus subsp. bolletii 1S-152-0914]EIU76508.1 hypothetical protein MM1S1540310_4955 [Mycobacteroides abscessus subsp. bolletii 1S-154-0310]EIU90871.1 hypothetical protein MM2B0626_0303 [Mycobacteroides abscessus subsp. bolletii 2B-0626]EIV28250.1 hypothetical protein MM2B0912S_0303 [Mycobacteroides abscessus subsp. bolletii 2B-0912-
MAGTAPTHESRTASISNELIRSYVKWAQASLRAFAFWRLSG